MPDPQPQAPHQPTRHPSRAHSAVLIHWGRLRWLHRLPLVLSRHATVSTVPRVQGQGRPPGQAIRKGHPMTEASVSFAGNLTEDPEVRSTEGGIARCMFRVAVSGRRDQEASFFTVILWRDQAEHAAESLAKGSRVVVVGRLQQRAWTAEDGSARSVVEVVAEELGPSLTGAPALGDRHADPGDAQPEPVTSSTTMTGRGVRRSMLAFRSVMSTLSSFVVRSFSTNSRPALRAAARRAGSSDPAGGARPTAARSPSISVQSGDLAIGGWMKPPPTRGCRWPGCARPPRWPVAPLGAPGPSPTSDMPRAGAGCFLERVPRYRTGWGSTARDGAPQRRRQPVPGFGHAPGLVSWSKTPR
jgi:single-strand DNA-binding protein